MMSYRAEMTLDEIKTELRTSTTVPVDALRAAVGHADDLAPDVYALAEDFCRGVYLLPEQAALLFFGLHVLASARHPRLSPCLIALLRQGKNDLDDLFPEYGSTSMAQLSLSVWDGDPDTLFHMIEYADLTPPAKATLFDVVARLTFDGRIPRDRTAAFLERYESTPLADPDDEAWWSWEDAVTRLGLVDLLPALERVWAKPLNEHLRTIDKDDSLAELHHAAAHPTDAKPFDEDYIRAVADPAEALGWLTRREESHARWLAERLAAEGPPPVDDDPAKDVRLTPEEYHWLEGFLYSGRVRDLTLPMEAVDGLFTAAIIGPVTVSPNEAAAAIWGESPDDAPAWDSPEQAAAVMALLIKHWNAIATRRMANGPFVPPIEMHDAEDERGALWAHGFGAGMALRGDDWGSMLENRRAAELVWSVLDLDAEGPDAKPVTGARRRAMLQQLPTVVQRISDYWKSPGASLPVSQPVRSNKVGRNDPCPCGSGKKYKKCCGSGNDTVH